jgi:transposase
MKENNWEHVKHNIFYGSNTVLGSPRGWLHRAVGIKQADLSLHETSLDPRKITVGGIWRRTQALPDTGTWPALYRFFAITDNLRRINRARDSEFFPVTGMAVAVPADHMFRVYQEFRKTAEWVWISFPQDSLKKPTKTLRDLDHEHLYSLFDTGLTARQVATQLDLSVQSVNYVYKKWELGRPVQSKNRKNIDHESVAQDIRLGHKICDIAQRYDVSRTVIYNVKKKFEIT